MNSYPGKMFYVLVSAALLAMIASSGWADEGQATPDPTAILEQALPEGVTLETATGEQIVEAVAVAVAAHPESAAAIVTAAILAAPDWAVEIITAALEAAPEQAGAIMAAALKIAPAAAGAIPPGLLRALQVHIPDVAQAMRLQSPVFRVEAPPSPRLP